MVSMGRICIGAKYSVYFVFLAAILVLVSSPCSAGSGSLSPAAGGAVLLKGFYSPPESARPRVWWHWLNGNVSKSGIRQDLAWMHCIGVGGVNLISVSVGAPQIVKKPAVYMTSRWKGDFRLAAKLTKRFGMKLGIDSSPGWNEAGGPWVKPFQAMKKLVWTSTVVQGGRPFNGVLRRPPSNTGPFQDVPMPGSSSPRPPKFADLKFYRDGIVIAYKAPLLDPKPINGVSSSGPLSPHMLSELSDGNLIDGPVLMVSNAKNCWLELQYASPVRLQGITLAATSSGTTGVAADVYVSNNGKSWKAVTRLDTDIHTWFDPGFSQTTVSFVPVMAEYVRVALAARLPPNLRRPLQFHIHELVLHSRATVNQFETKAYFRIAPDYYALRSQAPVTPDTVVNPHDVVNLTGRMSSTGTLDWTPPPGHWVVLRMGYSLEGTTNHPAPAAATGLEVDKLSRKDTRSYVNHYLDTYQALVGTFGHPGSVHAMTNDSTEIGMQNWTNRLIQNFKKLNGYSPIPWLPTLTGVVVGSNAQSDRFLWDFRHTINELLATNFYEETAKVAHSRGLLTYGEALENGRPTFGDGMRMRQYTSIPMGAMWAWGNHSGLDPDTGPDSTYVADLTGAHSVADIYGQNLVAAESMTSRNKPWAYAPRELKPIVDREFTVGVNRIFIHQSAEQPLDKPPGLSLSIYGQMFSRLDTWAKDARPWMEYIARCSYLLQQGHHAAGIAYFYGQGAPLTAMFQKKHINVPRGYGFDFFNANALQKLSVKDGWLVTNSGMRYRVLFLGGSSQFMTLRVLRRINKLVRMGATVVGQRPVASPSLKDNESTFQTLATKLFGRPGSSTVRHVGAGVIFTSGSLPNALKAIHFKPDFQYSKPKPNTEILFYHRQLAPGGSIYFVANQRDTSDRFIATFRVAGRVPELWNPVTGVIRPVSFRTTDGRTSVPLDLPSYGSIFVVFRKFAAHASKSTVKAQPQTLLTLHGPWKVTFPAGWGAPRQVKMQRLISWSKNPSSGVKYFSGTGTYTKTFRLPNHSPDSQIVLSLGQVWEIAKVSVNGEPVGTVWTPPFSLDVTKYVHPGKNTLSIAVTNLWVNRLIGDAQLGAKKKYTVTTHPTYEPDAPLRLSGLIGPVRIEAIPEINN